MDIRKKIIIAPNAFKECLSSPQVANAIERGIRRVLPDAEIVKIPFADGGDGTVEALVTATHGIYRTVRVTDPLGNRILAQFGILGDCNTAVIEMAAASGLRLVPPKLRNPMVTSTYGTGELIKSALDEGVNKIIIGIGGSATTDAGTGMAQALGVKLLAADGLPIGYGGKALERLAKIDLSELDPRVRTTKIIVACDVNIPLTGESGTAKLYAPQKGATPEMVEQLEWNMRHFVRIVARELNINIDTLPGAGAAGGLGAGLVAFLGAELKPGIDIVIEATGLADKMQNAALVITGEGKLDAQTAQGKAPVGIARVAKQFGVPVVAIGGSVADDANILFNYGIDKLYSLLRPSMTLEYAMQNAEKLLADTAEEMLQHFSFENREFKI
ncbi:MAG: glycerate kinase [bacterium]|nr:glycerate kinase [bacterium]